MNDLPSLNHFITYGVTSQNKFISGVHRSLLTSVFTPNEHFGTRSDNLIKKILVVHWQIERNIPADLVLAPVVRVNYVVVGLTRS